MITNESAKNTAFGKGFQRFTANLVEFGRYKGKRREDKSNARDKGEEEILQRKLSIGAIEF